jgi:hypothetical protein
LARGFFRSLCYVASVKRIAALVAVAAAALGVAGPAFAAPIGFSAETVASQDQGFKVDLTGGIATAQPNPTGIPPITRDEKFSPTGVLFGFNENANQLITIDPTTGIGTIVGSAGVGGNADRLAFTPDGRLWLASGANFYSVNTTTGAATLVGTLPSTVNGLVGTCSGNLLAVTEDAVNGTLIQFGPANPAGATTIGNLNLITGGATIGVTGLDFASDGTLWLLRGNVTTGRSESYTVSTTTGAATVVNLLIQNNGLEGLAIAPLSCPAPSPGAPVSAPSPLVVAPRFTG